MTKKQMYMHVASLIPEAVVSSAYLGKAQPSCSQAAEPGCHALKQLQRQRAGEDPADIFLNLVDVLAALVRLLLAPSATA